MPDEVKEVTDGNFDSEVLQAPVPVVVDMWAPWCGPCHMVSPVLEELASENGEKAKLCKLNVDENLATAQKYGIMAIPTVLFFQGGEERERLVGVRSKADYQRVIDRMVAGQ